MSPTLRVACIVALLIGLAPPVCGQVLPPPDSTAATGQGALLDYRIGPLDKLIGADNRVGLSNVLTGAATLAEATQDGRLANLFVVTSGPLPPNPAELLAGGRLRLLVAEARSIFDMVIFDGPPIMALADAPVMSAVTHGTVLVVEAGQTGRSQTKAALRRLAMTRAHLLGAVLTKFNARQATYGYGYGYGYQYDYDYGAAKPPRRTGLRALLRLTQRAS
jgi:capsular exopolysaccharide synthesis family protein